MRESALDASSQRSDRHGPLQEPGPEPRPPFHIPRRRLEPLEIARWLEARTDRIGQRWLTEVASRYDAWDEDQAALVERFFDVLLEMLPSTLGPYRDQVDPIWLQVAELYGSVAAQRGLAAGEVIEEFQVLREALIRLLYTEPPLAGVNPMSLRDILRVNRVVDRGVTQASVGHTDALFFALFKGSGVPDHLDADVLGEVHEQLTALHEEYRQVMRSLPLRTRAAEE